MGQGFRACIFCFRSPFLLRFHRSAEICQRLRLAQSWHCKHVPSMHVVNAAKQRNCGFSFLWCSQRHRHRCLALAMTIEPNAEGGRDTERERERIQRLNWITAARSLGLTARQMHAHIFAQLDTILLKLASTSSKWQRNDWTCASEKQRRNDDGRPKWERAHRRKTLNQFVNEQIRYLFRVTIIYYIIHEY